SKFDSSGSFSWARTWGGFSFDTGYGVAGDDSGNIYVTGRFWDIVDFDPGGEIDERTSAGGYDAFVSKFDMTGAYQWADTWGGTSSEEGNGITLFGSLNFYVVGDFGDSVDFDPSLSEDFHVSNGSTDVFLSKFKLDGTW
ncbi:MAG: hypothetical protein ABIC40_05915, partial [bacterium]